MNWKTEGDGPIWTPTINATEVKYGIPTDLLARVAYQESRFRRDIIDGTTKSPAGAVGLMQLLPRFFPGAGVSPLADINTAGHFLASLYNSLGYDWQKAFAAYNWGEGDLQHEYIKDHDQYILADMPIETQNYVKQICTDVPVQGVLYNV
jgi:soluble lytic murein transglycosylase-like protein